MNYRDLLLLTIIAMSTSSSYAMEPEASSDELPQESTGPLVRTRRGEHGVYIPKQDQPQNDQPVQQAQEQE